MRRQLRFIGVGLLFTLALISSAATAYMKLDYLYKSSDSGWRVWNSTRVTRVWPQGPAASVLRVDDEVVALNGRQVETLSPDALDFYGVEPGTTYTIIVRRNGQLQEFTLRTRPLPLLFWLAWIQVLVVLPAVFLLTGFAVVLLKPYDKQALLLALLLFSGPKDRLPEYAMASLPWWLGSLIEVSHLIWLPLFFSVLLHFFLVFPERSPLLRRFPRLEYYVYLPLLFGAVSSLLSKRWSPVGVVGDIAVFLLPLYVAGALVSLILNYRRANPLSRRKLRVVLAGSIAGFLPALALLVVAVFSGLSWDSPLFMQLGALTFFTLTLVPLSFAYAIVRHRVIPVSLIIRRSARYLLVSRGFIITEAILL